MTANSIAALMMHNEGQHNMECKHNMEILVWLWSHQADRNDVKVTENWILFEYTTNSHREVECCLFCYFMPRSCDTRL